MSPLPAFLLFQSAASVPEAQIKQQIWDLVLRYGVWGIAGALGIFFLYRFVGEFVAESAKALAQGVFNRSRPEPIEPLSRPPETKREQPTRIGPAPKPPTPDLAHPYPLPPNFTGRLVERKMLTEWFTTDSRPVCVVEAIGGMGKSALSWYWLHADVLRIPPAGYPELGHADLRGPKARRPEGVLFWSFYEREAHFGAFLRRAVDYLAAGQFPPDELSDREKLEVLLGTLGQRRILLVLDGLERELRAYSGYRAPYQGDDAEHDGGNDCCSPLAAIFLQHVASLPIAGRVLITSRMLPSELIGLAGCRRELLNRLSREDVVTFFEASGVKGTRAEIEQAVAPYGGHPLSVSLLARAIVKDRRMQGDIRAAGRHTVLDKLKGRQGHDILEVAYDEMTCERRELLGCIAAFRSPMDYEAIAVAADLNGVALDEAFDDLEGRGLLFRESERYDLHPVVRQYAYDRLSDKAGVHSRLQEYFEARQSPERAERLEDLSPTIELYWHLVGANRFDAAWVLFHSRLSSELFFRFGAYERLIDLLLALFPDGENQPPRLTEKYDQAWTMNSLANSYSVAGQAARAVLLYEMARDFAEKAEDKKNLAVVLGNLGNCHMSLGQFRAVEECLHRRLELSHEIKDDFGEAVGRQEMGRLSVYEGRFAEPENEWKVALESYKELEAQQWQGIIYAYRALLALLQGFPSAALEAALESRRLAGVSNLERDIVHAEWLLGWSYAALGDRTNAERNLHDALVRCRRINLIEFEPSVLLALARLDRDRQTALKALAIADRCGYRLNQADIHNLLARLALDAGKPGEAREHAQKAKGYAYCDGPPHYYKPAYEEAERLLAEAGEE